MRLRFFIALLGCFCLSGCFKPGPNPLSSSTIATFGLSDVSVDFAPNASINYTQAEHDLARTHNVLPSDNTGTKRLIKTPQGMAFIKAQATTKLRAAFERATRPVLRGSRPAQIHITITSIDIPGIARSFLTGGTSHLKAQIVLIDANTGNPIVSLPEQAEFIFLRGGGLYGTALQEVLEATGKVRPPFDRLAEKLAQDFAKWLSQGRMGPNQARARAPD